jgi:thioredoxin
MLSTLVIASLVCGGDFTDKFGFWHDDYGTACRDAIAQDRPLFIVFCEGESPTAWAVKSSAFMSEGIEKMLRDRYVRLYVNVSTDSGRALAKRFQAGPAPHLVILDRSTKWTVQHRSARIAEREFGEMLTNNCYCRLGADGRAVRNVEPDPRSVVTSSAATASNADVVRASIARGSPVRNIDESAFEREVIERSKERTVIVDFWAEWCGPCRALGPVLERCIRERDGEFALVKINVDHAPSLSSRYRVESIPAVKAFRDGKVVLEFVGLKSESDLRQILERLHVSEPPQVVMRDDDAEGRR